MPKDRQGKKPVDIPVVPEKFMDKAGATYMKVVDPADRFGDTNLDFVTIAPKPAPADRFGDTNLDFVTVHDKKGNVQKPE